MRADVQVDIREWQEVVVMSEALRLSEAFILGLHAACYLAGLGGGRASTGEIARYLSVSEAHLAKVMQRLVRAGLLKSVRGPGGGFTLARQSGDISLLDIYESLEGPFSPTTCLLGRDACLGRSCVLRGLLDAVNSHFEGYLRETDLGSAGSMLRIPDPGPYSGRERSSGISGPARGVKATGPKRSTVKGTGGRKRKADHSPAENDGHSARAGNATGGAPSDKGKTGPARKFRKPAR